METKEKLSTLWIFVMFNMAFADIVGFMNPGVLDEIVKGATPIKITQGLMLGFSILLEIPIAMILLSRVLKYRANRWANIIAGIIMAAVQILTLFIGIPTNYYVFFSAIEIACVLFIVWTAWKWKNPENVTNNNI